jgi:hypothetical protein
MAVVSELKLALQNKNEELKKAILLVGKKLWFAFTGQLLQNLTLRSPGIDSTSLCSLAGRHDNTI